MRRSKTEETVGEGVVKSPDPVDVHVGRRLRLRRTLLGMSQEQLANAVGVTFQQIQKYERGSNRVSASRLYDISKVLGVPVAFFFEDIGEDVTAVRKAPALPDVDGLSEPAIPAYEQDPLQKNETLELIRAYWRLPTETVRKRALDLLKSLSGRD
ncbi:MAG: helix-turn-helix transcriptional regulator [Rhodospirillum sp.]|nr:helix-turn-helix transcriptional regulator [Rhodospirillum sp.]MCF8487861.1 helix-turn-helix transcriptional regulator [Rhodospirillum sp.]MCF8499183.1 helix-turn-helix transcriptional regulator [Rhodospirillum sp.]